MTTRTAGGTIPPQSPYGTSIVSTSASIVALTTEAVILTLPSFTYRTGYTYKLTFNFTCNDSAGTAPVQVLRVRKTNVSGTVIVLYNNVTVPLGGGGDAQLQGFCYLTNSTGADITAAYCMTGVSNSGTATFKGNATGNPAYLLIEQVPTGYSVVAAALS